MTRAKAALFDLGNVLVRLRFDRGRERLAALTGAPAGEDPAKLYLGEHALAFNRGELSPDAFLDGLAALARGPRPSRKACAEAWCDIFDPWPQMELFAEELLAGGHPAFLLSNTDVLHFTHLAARIPVLARMRTHLSYEVGLVKPDPAYFRCALERFGLEAAACAFIDDRAENVEAARALGIPSLLFHGDPAQARAFFAEQGFRLRGGRWYC